MNLTNDQLKNLLAFLNRVQLQGTEAEALVQLKIIIMKELEKRSMPPARDSNTPAVKELSKK